MTGKRWASALPIALIFAFFLAALPQPGPFVQDGSSSIHSGTVLLSVLTLGPDLDEPEELPQLARLSWDSSSPRAQPAVASSNQGADVRADVCRSRPRRHVPRFDDDDH